MMEEEEHKTEQKIKVDVCQKNDINNSFDLKSSFGFRYCQSLGSWVGYDIDLIGQSKNYSPVNDEIRFVWRCTKFGIICLLFINIPFPTGNWQTSQQTISIRPEQIIELWKG